MVISTGRNHGRFAKGHHLFGKLNGIKNGRKKSIAGKVKDALSIAEEAMPQLYLDMIRDAQNPKASIRDRQMCREYLSDRIYGKPNLPLTGLGGKELIINFVIGKGYARGEPNAPK